MGQGQGQGQERISDAVGEEDLKQPSCRAYDVRKFMESGVFRDVDRYIRARIITLRDQLEAGIEEESAESIRGRLKEARGFVELFPVMLAELEEIEAGAVSEEKG